MMMRICWLGAFVACAGWAWGETPRPVFNRAPLVEKPYAELPLGAIQPRGWLRGQLERMADGMTGRLDELYPEVIGQRNGWLGGDGDGWERGPYWIDGLYPLARLLDDEALLAKAQRWIDWTLENQREDGYLGPLPFDTPPEREPGLQRGRRRDWWPKMVMLKVLQQHYMASGDERVLDCLTRYFRYQLRELPNTPLDHWSYWANRRGGDNLMVVYWLYNLTGDEFLLELGDLLHQQTHPYTEIFLDREKVRRFRFGGQSDEAFHCVNLAQGIKTPIIRYQADGREEHLRAVSTAFEDIRQAHGQPHGLYGGDEGLHGRVLTQGSELCTAVEMMFSLEKMLEITGELEFADRLERIALNALPTQVSDDFMTRQYYQQANQIAATVGRRNFFQDRHGERIVYGLLSGYPCCTCNLHQGWPKFTQHLWMATADEGLAALVYAPSKVTAEVAGGHPVTITESTRYPFEDSIRFQVDTEGEVPFPLQLRVPAWCDAPTLRLNGQPFDAARRGSLLILDRTWSDGDTVTLHLPARLRVERWHENSASLARGPLLFALEIPARWSETEAGLREARPRTDWNQALVEQHLQDPERFFRLSRREPDPAYPWNLENAPLRLTGRGVPRERWRSYNESSGPVPWSPQRPEEPTAVETISLVPYGCTTLRISAFPTVALSGAASVAAYEPEELRHAAARASHAHPNNPVDAVRLPVEPLASSDRSIPRWTSWPQRGREQWIELDLEKPTRVSAIEAYWYDDGRGVRAPGAWQASYLTAEGWSPIGAAEGSGYGTELDRYNTVRPSDDVVTGTVRLRLTPQGNDKAIGALSVVIQGETVETPTASLPVDEGRPNFVFVLTDDISPNDLSVYGNEVIQTPNLDRLARRGLVFDNAYLTISSCSPSRCSIITGRYPHNTGAPELHQRLPADQTTFVQVLRDAGYHTILSGKNHMGDPRQLGFDVASDSRPAGSENWLSHLRNRPRQRPFFAWFSSHDAHHGWQRTDEAPRYDPATVAVEPMLHDGPLTREELANYYHEVSRTDHYVGRLLDELDAQGIADNTYVVYTSDNGRPFPRCKTYLYESGIQMPLLVTGPGVVGGRTASLVSSIDLAATFLDLAGASTPETVQGVSLVDVLQDPSATVRDVAFAERNWHVYRAHERMVRSGDFLYLWNAWPENHNVSGESAVPDFPAARELWDMAAAGRLTPAQAMLTRAPQPAEMLFDVRRDPHQFTNLAGDPEHAETLDRMRALLERWQSRTGDSVPQAPTPNRQPLHQRVNKQPPRGEVPGQAEEATSINEPGPVRLADGA